METLATTDLQLRKKGLHLAKYRRLMSYPVWNFFTQSILESRSYEKGLDACLLLLRYTEENRKKLTTEECEHNLRAFYLFLLTLLDKLDKWEEYLTLWESLRLNTTMTVCYDKAALRNHSARIRPFVLSQGGSTVEVHFLYLKLHRKELIERKLARKRAGGKTGHLLHAQQEKLPNSEIRRRLGRVKARAEYAEKIAALIKRVRTGSEWATEE